MYPIPFHVFGYPVSSFGIMLALGFLAGTWLASRRMGELGIEPEMASTMLIYSMVGGIVGAKLYYAITFSIRDPDLSFVDLLLSRDGLVFYGGLIGATIAAIVGTRIHGISTLAFANCAALAAAIGQALGRVGCFLVGDDYGHPTSLPWGVAFPEGAPPIDVPVHPTQLYESSWLFLVTWVLWKRRKRSPFLFGEYMVLNGAGRFVNEFWRLNPKVAGLSEAQWIGIALVVGGIIGWLLLRRRPAEPAAATAG